MKRFVSAIALCSSLLAVMSAWFYRAEAAKEDAIITLLNLPAPPAPNPLVKPPSGSRPAEFYDRETPPPDNAPIEDLMDYWSRMSAGYRRDLAYNPTPSAAAANRILREIADQPERIAEFINALREDGRAVEMARNVYRRLEATGSDEEEGIESQLRGWLKMNTADFSGELESVASRIQDANEYVNNGEDLLALTKVDWERAEPVVSRLYADKTQKVSQVLATWALYKRALQSGGSDVDKYRDELKAVVENKEATAGMRDLALDALVKEGDFQGRDDWYVGLLSDETLSELRVRGSTYTGLTTIMYHQSDDRLSERMIELMSSDNIWVRTAAAKNLLIRINQMTASDRNENLRRRMIQSMLPWLSDKGWLKADSTQRSALVTTLATMKMPEAVPALIDALDETAPMSSSAYSNATNAIANAANVVANMSNTAANARIDEDNTPTNANASTVITYNPKEAQLANLTKGGTVSQYHPLRSAAVSALANQGDPRAAQPLRRVLMESADWERTSVVKAIIDCHGFTPDEQVAAIEFMARSAGDVLEEDRFTANTDPSVYRATPQARARMSLRIAIAEQGTAVLPKVPDEDEEVNAEFENYSAPSPEAYAANAVDPYHDDHGSGDEEPLNEENIKYLVASQLISADDPDATLVRATVDRIGALEPREPAVAAVMRKVILGWDGAAVNTMILRDIKAGRLDADAILKMLAIRKQLREKQMDDVMDMRSGVPAATAIAACILEDPADLDTLITNGADAAKIALFACGRLIRVQFPVEKAAAILKSPNRALAIAAERYLESEDSAKARAAVLALYPNQAKILGATTTFNVSGVESVPGIFLRDVFSSVNPYFGAESYAYLTFMQETDAEVEKRLQKEVTTDPNLLGVYAFDRHFVRIYADKAVFSWEDDPARYRERVFEPQQFDSLKNYLAGSNVDTLPPFLVCSSDCDSKQLLMIGKAGGRRVFVKSDSKLPPFFASLKAFFDEMKKQPSRLKYYASETIPGLEVLYEADQMSAVTVWKNGADLRLLVTDDNREKAILSDTDRQHRREIAEAEAEGKEIDSNFYSRHYSAREARRYEASIWYRIAKARLAAAVDQPAEAQYIPTFDQLAPAALFGQWSSKGAGFEIRADHEGLYKVAGARSVRIRRGNYNYPVVTPDGRWAVASKYDDDKGMRIVRINLATNREYEVQSGETYLSSPVAPVPGRNLVLVSAHDEEDDHHGEYDYESGYHPSAYDNGRDYYFLEPATGKIYAGSGEVRPLAHQTFRGLQPTGRPYEYWAAMPRGKAGTLFGIYSTRTFTFKPILKLPKILFDSVEMWVDGGESKVYFVHEGHLLSAPFTTPGR